MTKTDFSGNLVTCDGHLAAKRDTVRGVKCNPILEFEQSSKSATPLWHPGTEGLGCTPSPRALDVLPWSVHGSKGKSCVNFYSTLASRCRAIALIVSIAGGRPG